MQPEDADQAIEMDAEWTVLRIALVRAPLQTSDDSADELLRRGEKTSSTLPSTFSPRQAT